MFKQYFGKFSTSICLKLFSVDRFVILSKKLFIKWNISCVFVLKCFYDVLWCLTTAQYNNVVFLLIRTCNLFLVSFEYWKTLKQFHRSDILWTEQQQQVFSVLLLLFIIKSRVHPKEYMLIFSNIVIPYIEICVGFLFCLLR